MNIPRPTPIYRIMHVDNLEVCLRRGGFHAPNHVPDDGLKYRTIHNMDIQNIRRRQTIPCGPKGTVHDYVPFYFGPRSPMLLQLHSGQVEGYDEGQEPLIYIVSTVEEILNLNLQFVFSDGHGIAYFTNWFNSLDDLDKVDWKTVYARYWHDTINDMDRQRRKQAEFLIHKFCPIKAVAEIGVINERMKQKCEQPPDSSGGQKSQTYTKLNRFSGLKKRKWVQHATFPCQILDSCHLDAAQPGARFAQRPAHPTLPPPYRTR